MKPVITSTTARALLHRRHILIKNGVLTNRLHSRETAAKMNEKPTGNARAISYASEPIVRMTNTYMEPRRSDI